MRLIDADKLMEDIIKICKCQPYLEGMQSEIVYIQDVVDEQPTAFDVDKVARHIEDLKEENFKRGIKENEPALLYASSCLHKALEIAKAGGIDE